MWRIRGKFYYPFSNNFQNWQTKAPTIFMHKNGRLEENLLIEL
jgi:hypothetical protein